mmetsp:Transcript_94395/g.185107  ORF Transcript_94395/g.185107 Transcript_94395/m.185107 type:complete len:226 (+) Transcript_94395:352-1029(+)
MARAAVDSDRPKVECRRPAAVGARRCDGSHAIGVQVPEAHRMAKIQVCFRSEENTARIHQLLPRVLRRVNVRVDIQVHDVQVRRDVGTEIPGAKHHAANPAGQTRDEQERVPLGVRGPVISPSPRGDHGDTEQCNQAEEHEGQRLARFRVSVVEAEALQRVHPGEDNHGHEEAHEDRNKVGRSVPPDEGRRLRCKRNGAQLPAEGMRRTVASVAASLHRGITVHR